jgi:hypothetical protein
MGRLSVIVGKVESINEHSSSRIDMRADEVLISADPGGCRYGLDRTQITGSAWSGRKMEAASPLGRSEHATGASLPGLKVRLRR